MTVSMNYLQLLEMMRLF